MNEIDSLQESQPPLTGLHDIMMPEAVAWVPQTAGWYMVAILFSVGLVWIALVLRRRWFVNRYRKVALLELDRIEAMARNSDFREKGLAELPVLLKRTALSCKPREEVAALTGEEWLRYLDASYGGTEFVHGPGRLLIQLGYRAHGSSQEAEQRRVEDLFPLVRRWIVRHHA
ncbi:MAG: DUF4381 domain-containing protein [Acidimicrobiia bacterium]|nr:DUF4381 domain-containing protein [Acidimicrobiia bacterium]